MKCDKCGFFCLYNGAEGLCINWRSEHFGEPVCVNEGCDIGLPPSIDRHENVFSWEPFSVRPMSEDEQEACDYEHDYIVEGSVPEENEEVAVSYGDLIAFDTWHQDGGFEVFGFAPDAWMRVRPYRKDR